MLALTNGILIDGTGQRPIPRTTIVIEGNRIQTIGTEIPYPKNASVINLNGLTVLPGFIDSHLHLGGLTIDKPGKKIGQVSLWDMISFLLDYSRNYYHRRSLAIENGVTTIRSAGDLYPQIIRLRDKINAGKLSGPRIFAPGPVFTAPGGHPTSTIYKGNRYIIEHTVRQVDSADVARAEVEKLAEGGVDCIKAIVSDVDPMDLDHTVPKLTLNILEALINEAHENQLRVMVHTGNQDDTRDAVRVGADSVEHGILPGADSAKFNDELINLMLERNTYFVPTLAIAWAYKNLYPAVFDTAKKVTKQLHDAGVKIATGTDSGTPGVVIGKAVHKEMQLFIEAGLSPMESITAATKNAAENIGIGHELGTIKQDKLADIIAVSGNPSKEITDSQNIKLVMKDGKILINKIGSN